MATRRCNTDRRERIIEDLTDILEKVVKYLCAGVNV